MNNRPAYKLNTFIRLYNIFQIVANIFIVREFLAAYPDGMAFKCVAITFSTDPAALRVRFFINIIPPLFIINRKINYLQLLNSNSLKFFLLVNLPNSK